MTRLSCGCFVRRAGGIRLCPQARDLHDALVGAHELGNVVLANQVIDATIQHFQDGGLRGPALLKAMKRVRDDGARRG